MRASQEETSQALEMAVPRDLFLAEIREWARRIDVDPREIRIRKMSSKWGSCSSTGRLTFNAELLWQRSDFRRRVTVEELLHLKVPNHSKLFRTLLKAYLAQAEEKDQPCGARDANSSK
jgi:predicted metal-dependent hydrolase